MLKAIILYKQAALPQQMDCDEGKCSDFLKEEFVLATATAALFVVVEWADPDVSQYRRPDFPPCSPSIRL